MKFEEFRAMALAKRQVGRYKDLFIHRPSDGNWYVGYIYYGPNELGGRLFKEHGQLKGFKDMVEKEKEAEMLLQDVRDWLEAGNSPYGY